MIVRAWRIVADQYKKTALNGEGARRYGGRWNNKEVPMIYLANSRPLAAMELFIHINSHQVLKHYLFISVAFDSQLMLSLDQEALPCDWADSPAPLSTKRIGDEWSMSQKSLVLEVPSVLFPGEFNYLVNPIHPNFDQIQSFPPESFQFDPRLIRRRNF